MGRRLSARAYRCRGGRVMIAPSSTNAVDRAGRCETACASAPAASRLPSANEKKQGHTTDQSNRVFGFSHSLRLAGFLLPLLSRSRASFAPSGVPGALSVTFGACRRRGSQSFRDQPLNQVAVSVIHVFNALSKLSLRPDHHGRSNREWRYPISVMRCPK
jgi:hypothetical protein